MNRLSIGQIHILAEDYNITNHADNPVSILLVYTTIFEVNTVKQDLFWSKLQLFSKFSKKRAALF
jgi:hypothetical protein